MGRGTKKEASSGPEHVKLMQHIKGSGFSVVDQTIIKGLFSLAGFS